MDGVIDELLRLEDAKYKALIEFDASAYSQHVALQNRLVDTAGVPDNLSTSSRDKLFHLSKLCRLNSALYQNLLSISPWVVLADASYTPSGQSATVGEPHRFAAEV